MLQVKDIAVEFHRGHQAFRAVDGVSFEVESGESVAIVGESGCGKTTVARTILGLQPLSGGEILHDGVKVARRNLAERIGMVWQDPFASLDPRWTIMRCLEEPGVISGRKVEVGTLMSEVGLDPSLGDRRPAQLSGGQRQRVAIGRALALRPPLVILDEPTAALDLSIQAQILNLLKDIQQSRQTSYLYISHDLNTVRFIAQRVLVMLKGKVVESGPVAEIFENPQHEYTKALLAAAPRLDQILGAGV